MLGSFSESENLLYRHYENTKTNSGNKLLFENIDIN